MLTNHQNFLLTIIFAMCLRIAPLPASLIHLNPDWVLLMLIYWSLALPYQQGVFNAWIVGLFTDILMGRALGEHALIYALLIYICITLHKRLRQYPLLQQSMFIFSCLLGGQIMIFWIESIQGVTRFALSAWLPVITGTLCWPLIKPSLQFIRNLETS